MAKKDKVPAKADNRATKAPDKLLKASDKTAAGTQESTAMDKREVSGMLTLMKYTSSDKCKGASANDKDVIKSALCKYQKMDKADKHAFLKQWRQHSGSKDVSWMREVVDTRTEETIEEDEFLEGHMTMHEIFDANKFNASNFGAAEAAAVLQDLIGRAEEDFGYKAEVRRAANPLLTTYHYKKLKPHSSRSSSTKKVSSSEILGGDAGKMQQGLDKVMADAEGSPACDIKIENPEFHQMRQQLAILKAGKNQFDRAYLQAMDVASQMKLKASKDPAFQDKAMECERNTNVMTEYLGNLRDKVAVWSTITVSDDCAGVAEKVSGSVEELTHHLDAYKLYKKRMQGVLQ